LGSRPRRGYLHGLRLARGRLGGLWHLRQCPADIKMEYPTPGSSPPLTQALSLASLYLAWLRTCTRAPWQTLPATWLKPATACRSRSRRSPIAGGPRATATAGTACRPPPRASAALRCSMRPCSAAHALPGRAAGVRCAAALQVYPSGAPAAPAPPNNCRDHAPACSRHSRIASHTPVPLQGKRGLGSIAVLSESLTGSDARTQ